MNPKWIFPSLLIVLQVGAGIVCLAQRDIRHGIYWLAAAVVNAAATM